MKKALRKIICIVIIVVISINVYEYYNITKINDDSFCLLTTGTDDERIYDTIEKFQQAYADGDFESLLKCCSTSFSNSLNSGVKLYSFFGNKFLSYFTKGFLGMDEDVMKSIWSTGTSLSPMELDIIEIRYISDSVAEVELNYIEKQKSERAYLQMKKKDEAWRVDSDFYLRSKV